MRRVRTVRRHPRGNARGCRRDRRGQPRRGGGRSRPAREGADRAAAFGREKVYIIDEAQRLSREAFDALLKVFEPPDGVRFVLATTEPHKMPATIVGRCQRFDFRRLSVEQLADHLRTVAIAEGATLTDDAALSIARHSEGSARDALSLLDQASVLGDRTIDDARRWPPCSDPLARRDPRFG